MKLLILLMIFSLVGGFWFLHHFHKAPVELISQLDHKPHRGSGR